MNNEPRRPRLYSDAFYGVHQDVEATQSDRFRIALAAARTVAAPLAGEIAGDLPQFTQHDVSHMDALWELADLIAGSELSLNPAEAFVLGCAILVHDLAMSHAAYSLGGAQLRDHPDWPDTLAARIRSKSGRAPSPSELASPQEEIAAEAEQDLLRNLHSEAASRLPTASWTQQDGTTAFLIADEEIRTAYGSLIGRIAASHHMDKSLLAENFGAPAGAISSAPPDWTVDSLVIACLLRTADAAHADASRVPSILAHVRQIRGYSLQHWTFQKKLQRPYLRGNRLVFTAPSGFGREEIASWWLAYDVLVMIDGELHGVDNLLVDNDRRRFEARGVAQIATPKECSQHLPCHGWEPVTARVQVSDVASLVQRLGGEAMYGDQPVAAVRELVTNACDAVMALTSYHTYRGTRLPHGRVEISYQVEDDGTWLSISDNGIGMTSSALTTALLDFGRSSWLDSDITAENPGLIASAFEPVGKFGIGFFSCFMLGDRVQVLSRARSAAPADTWVLEFGNGLANRPALRKCDVDEERAESGTEVRVLLNGSMVKHGQVHFVANGTRSDMQISSLAHLIPWLLPAASVDLYTQDLGEAKPRLIVTADDWITLDGEQFLDRVTGGGHEIRAKRELGAKLEVLYSPDGRPVARITGLNEFSVGTGIGESLSVVTAGPARTSSAVRGIVGVLIGRPSRAARDAATPVIEEEHIAQWATDQAQHVAQGAGAGGGSWVRDVGIALDALGADTYPLAQWQVAQAWLDAEGLMNWIKERDHFLFTFYLDAEVMWGAEDREVEIGPSVLLYGWNRGAMEWPKYQTFHEPIGHTAMLISILAAAWGIDLDAAYDLIKEGESEKLSIGHLDGEDVVADALLVRRPDSANSL